MQALLFYGVPILLGANAGYFLAWPVNAVLALGAAAFAGWMLWTTKDAELGAIVGVLAAIVCGIFILAMGVTVLVVYGPTMDLSVLSWVVRQ